MAQLWGDKIGAAPWPRKVTLYTETGETGVHKSGLCATDHHGELSRNALTGSRNEHGMSSDGMKISQWRTTLSGSRRAHRMTTPLALLQKDGA